MHRFLSGADLFTKRLAADGPADQLIESATSLLAKAEHILKRISVFALERLDDIEAILNLREIDRVLLKGRRIALDRACEVVRANREAGCLRPCVVAPDREWTLSTELLERGGLYAQLYRTQFRDAVSREDEAAAVLSVD